MFVLTPHVTQFSEMILLPRPYSP